MVRCIVGSIPHGGPNELLFLFQPVLHNWCNKGRGMFYPVCGMAHIKESLLLIGNISPCGGSGFPLSLSEWSFSICLGGCICMDIIVIVTSVVGHWLNEKWVN